MWTIGADLLLTVIFAIFVNIISFPVGILPCALGRRADSQGIPVMDRLAGGDHFDSLASKYAVD